MTRPARPVVTGAPAPGPLPQAGSRLIDFPPLYLWRGEGGEGIDRNANSLLSLELTIDTLIATRTAELAKLHQLKERCRTARE